MPHRISMAGMALVGILCVLDFHPEGASAEPVAGHPHYETAFSADTKVCGQVRSLYNRLLDAAILKATRSAATGNGVTTNFAYTNPAAFAGIGLKPPAAPKDIQGIEFFSIFIGDPNDPRTLAKETRYRGNTPQVSMAVFKAGRAPRLGDGQDAFYFPPVKVDDVEWLISVEGLSQSQGDPDRPKGAYFLKKWPGFSSLLSIYHTANRATFVLFIYEAVPVTVSAFQATNKSLIIIYDEYLSMLKIKNLKTTSEDAGIVLVQRLTENGIEDLCYLVTAPGVAANTLRPKHSQ